MDNIKIVGINDMALMRRLLEEIDEIDTSDMSDEEVSELFWGED